MHRVVYFVQLVNTSKSTGCVNETLDLLLDNTTDRWFLWLLRR